MSFELVDRFYVGLTSRAPFGLALVGRRRDGRIVVGACYEDTLTITSMLNQLKALLKASDIAPSSITGWTDDSEEWIRIAEQATEISGVNFQGTYQPPLAARQALYGVLALQGPATSRFQIDQDGPGAEILAQRIDARAEGGVIDAVGLCCLRIEDEFPGGVAQRVKETKVILHRPGGIFGNSWPRF